MTDSGSPTGDFISKLSAIKAELDAQGRRVLDLCEAAFDAFFSDDVPAARRVIDLDEPIDRADVRIENMSVELLHEAARVSNELPPEKLREVLVVVKANNELERIADCAVTIAEEVAGRQGAALPDTLRVMTNSVLGVLQDACRCLELGDADIAKRVLRSEDTILGFRKALRQAAERQIASGDMTVQTGFVLHELSCACEHMADHAVNIAEQVLYLVTGTIVRHCETGWIEVNL
ncbi:MAG: phosphate signaling complex PhoU family protein [Phycisphaerales bacterium]